MAYHKKYPTLLYFKTPRKGLIFKLGKNIFWFFFLQKKSLSIFCGCFFSCKKRKVKVFQNPMRLGILATVAAKSPHIFRQENFPDLFTFLISRLDFDPSSSCSTSVFYWNNPECVLTVFRMQLREHSLFRFWIVLYFSCNLSVLRLEAQSLGGFGSACLSTAPRCFFPPVPSPNGVTFLVTSIAWMKTGVSLLIV